MFPFDYQQDIPVEKKKTKKRFSENDTLQNKIMKNEKFGNQTLKRSKSIGTIKEINTEYSQFYGDNEYLLKKKAKKAKRKSLETQNEPRTILYSNPNESLNQSSKIRTDFNKFRETIFKHKKAKLHSDDSGIFESTVIASKDKLPNCIETEGNAHPKIKKRKKLETVDERNSDLGSQNSFDTFKAELLDGNVSNSNKEKHEIAIATKKKKCKSTVDLQSTIVNEIQLEEYNITFGEDNVSNSNKQEHQIEIPTKKKKSKRTVNLQQTVDLKSTVNDEIKLEEYSITFGEDSIKVEKNSIDETLDDVVNASILYVQSDHTNNENQAIIESQNPGSDKKQKIIRQRLDSKSPSSDKKQKRRGQGLGSKSPGSDKKQKRTGQGLGLGLMSKQLQSTIEDFKDYIGITKAEALEAIKLLTKPNPGRQKKFKTNVPKPSCERYVPPLLHTNSWDSTKSYILNHVRECILIQNWKALADLLLIIMENPEYENNWAVKEYSFLCFLAHKLTNPSFYEEFIKGHFIKILSYIPTQSVAGRPFVWFEQQVKMSMSLES